MSRIYFPSQFIFSPQSAIIMDFCQVKHSECKGTNMCVLCSCPNIHIYFLVMNVHINIYIHLYFFAFLFFAQGVVNDHSRKRISFVTFAECHKVSFATRTSMYFVKRKREREGERKRLKSQFLFMIS